MLTFICVRAASQEYFVDIHDRLIVRDVKDKHVREMYTKNHCMVVCLNLSGIFNFSVLFFSFKNQ